MSKLWGIDGATDQSEDRLKAPLSYGYLTSSIVLRTFNFVESSISTTGKQNIQRK